MVQQFHEAGFMVDLNDDHGTTLNKKIRSAQLAQYNYIFGMDGQKDENCVYLKLVCHTYDTNSDSPLLLLMSPYLIITITLYHCVFVQWWEKRRVRVEQ